MKRGDKNDILENMQRERKITQLVRTYVHTYNYGLSIGVGGGDESPPMDLYSEVARYIRSKSVVSVHEYQVRVSGLHKRERGGGKGPTRATYVRRLVSTYEPAW